MSSLITEDVATEIVLTATAGQTVFSFDFAIFNDADLEVYVDGVLVDTYSVTGAGEVGGGSITMDDALDGGEEVVLVRAVPVRTEIDLPSTGPYSSDDIDSEFDRVFAVLQQIKTLTARAALVGYGEAGLIIPPAAERISKFLGFDASGDLIMSSGTGTDDGLRGDLGEDTGPANVGYAADGDEAVSRNLLIKVRESVTMTDRNPTVAGVRAALAEFGSAGGTLTMKAPLSLASGALGTAILIPQNDITIEMEGHAITITGTDTPAPAFEAKNVSGFRIRNGEIIGNNRAIDNAYSGSAICFRLDDDATEDLVGMFVENVRLSNFKGSGGWIRALNENTAGLTMQGWRDQDLRGISATGNSLVAASVGTLAHVVLLYGYTGYIFDIVSRGFYAQARHIKGGYALFHMINRATFYDPTVMDAGVVGAADDSAAYALLAYANLGEMTDIEYNSPHLYDPRSVGIYGRGVDRIRINNVSGGGQTDTVTTSLPKGLLAFAGSTGIRIRGGEMGGAAGGGSVNPNAIDIMINAPNAGTKLDAEIQGVTAKGATDFLIVNPGGAAGAIDKVWSINNHAETTGRTYYVYNGLIGGRYLRDFRVIGGSSRSSGAVQTFDLSGTSGGAIAGEASILGHQIYSNNTGIFVANMTGRVVIDQGTEIIGLGGLVAGVNLSNATNFKLDNTFFADMGSGYAYYAGGTAAGEIGFGNRYRNVANRADPTSLGATDAAPTIAGNAGEIIALATPASGSPIGHICTGGTTWLPLFELA